MKNISAEEDTFFSDIPTFEELKAEKVNADIMEGHDERLYHAGKGAAGVKSTKEPGKQLW